MTKLSLDDRLERAHALGIKDAVRINAIINKGMLRYPVEDDVRAAYVAAIGEQLVLPTPADCIGTDGPVRRRKNQDVTRWPPSMSQAEIEKAVDDLCGCKGCDNCDCVSVFNAARGDAWYEHNTGEKP